MLEKNYETDVLVIGCGVGGAVTALAAADNGCKVIMLSRKEGVEDTSTVRTQGGIIYKGKLPPEELGKDIQTAGCGRCWEVAVDHLTKVGPELVDKWLVKRAGVKFDEGKEGYDLTREGGHGEPRIAHCRDKTGYDIAHCLFDTVRKHPNVTVLEDATAIDLLTTTHHSRDPQDLYRPTECFGAYVLLNKPHEIIEIYAKETVLATGGVGRIYLHTTNNESARGDGYAMAYRAGARLLNMEFVQFHPTTLYLEGAKNFLITESLRGEGAVLKDRHGNTFMEHYHEMASLAPRDIVARAIHHEMLKEQQNCMYLDISFKDPEWLKERFPTIYQNCLQFGVDITKEPIPIVPAAHYSCGGVLVDLKARSSIDRLRAVGEVSCTGIHGANRLASTSLLEAVIWGACAGEDIAKRVAEKKDWAFPVIDPWKEEREPVEPAMIKQDWMTIRQTMWNYVGLVRSPKRLHRAKLILRELQNETETFYRRAALTDTIIGLRNGLQAAMIVLYSAILNPKSSGCHYIEND